MANWRIYELANCFSAEDSIYSYKNFTNLNMPNVERPTLPLREKLNIAARIVLALALIGGIIWEFMQPNENKFRSFVRIILWFIFFIIQIDHLYKKFRGVKSTNNL